MSTTTVSREIQSAEVRTGLNWPLYRPTERASSRGLWALGPLRRMSRADSARPAATVAGGSCPVPERMAPSTVPGQNIR